MTTAVATNKLSGKWIGWLTSLLGGLFVAWCFYDPSTPKVNLYWFGTIMAIGMFAFDLLPNFVTAVLLLMYYILTGIAAPDVAFVGWTTPIPWLCMCGMLIGVLMEKTRLANRIALFTISRVGTTPIRMYIAFLLAGFIVSAIIPDVITVDILFMAIATGMCQSLNLSVTSRSATTIVLAAFFGATISSAAYLPNNTGIIGLLMVKDMGVPFTWLGFYSENLPYQIGHALLAYTILHLFGGRELGEHISRCRACAEAELATLGKMSRDEKKTLVLALLALVAFISEPWHGIPGYFAFCSMVLLGFTPIFNLMEASDLRRCSSPSCSLSRAAWPSALWQEPSASPHGWPGAVPYLGRSTAMPVRPCSPIGWASSPTMLTPVAAATSLRRAHGRNRHLAEPWDQAHPVQLPVRA
ncbi:MAG: SLC13 family permease [Bilophila wadsworthia]